MDPKGIAVADVLCAAGRGREVGSKRKWGGGCY